MNIQSNIIKGEFKDTIVSKTLNEILDSIRSVYGPFGTDIFIKKLGMTYLTRDGKEVMESMRFDNELSLDVLRILNQAVDRQARIAGDGTTTLLVLYINLYNELRKNEYLLSNSTSIIRRKYAKLMNKIVSVIKNSVYEIDTNSEEFKSMIYTCVQDPDLVAKIYDIMKDSDKDTYISVNRNDLDTELVVKKHQSPLLKGEKLYSTFTIPDSGELDNSVVLYVDGQLNIINEMTLKVLLGTVDNRMKKNFIILCSGLTDNTRNSIQRLSEWLRTITPQEKSQLNNIMIFKLAGYLNYTNEMKQDISCMVYNEPEITGLVNHISFETLVYRTFMSEEPITETTPVVYTLDIPTQHMGRVWYSYMNPITTQYDIKEGLKININMNEMTKDRLEKLRLEIQEEKSPIRRKELIQRLQVLFGTFIEVSVGSKLLKDSQREFELILDAITSSQAALKYGILRKNSLIEVIEIIDNYLPTDKMDEEILKVLKTSLVKTLSMLINNKLKTLELDKIERELPTVLKVSEYRNINLFNEQGLLEQVKKGSIAKGPMDRYDHAIWTGTDGKVHDRIVEPGLDDIAYILCDLFADDKIEADGIMVEVTEPVSIIENLLLNSTISLDLALSEIFIVNEFMNNYI